MKSWIELNSGLRAEASKRGDKFGKDFYKLLNNSCYGRSFMDQRKHMNARFFTGVQRAQFLKYRCSPWVSKNAVHIFGENLVMCERQRPMASYQCQSTWVPLCWNTASV